jgi:hypothetical protein
MRDVSPAASPARLGFIDGLLRLRRRAPAHDKQPQEEDVLLTPRSPVLHSNNPYLTPDTTTGPALRRISIGSRLPPPKSRSRVLAQWARGWYDAHGSETAVALAIFMVFVVPILLWGGVEHGDKPFEPEAVFGAWSNETRALGEFIAFPDSQWLQQKPQQQQPMSAAHHDARRERVATQKYASLLTVHRDIHHVCNLKTSWGAPISDVFESGVRMACNVAWQRTRAALDAMNATDHFFAAEWPSLAAKAAADLERALSGPLKHAPQDCARLRSEGGSAMSEAPLGYCAIPCAAPSEATSKARLSQLSLEPLAAWQLKQLSAALALTDKGHHGQCLPCKTGPGSPAFYDDRTSAKYLHAVKGESFVHETQRHVGKLGDTADLEKWALKALASTAGGTPIGSGYGPARQHLEAITDRLRRARETVLLLKRLAGRNAKAAAAHCAWRDRIVAGVQGLRAGDVGAWYAVGGDGEPRGESRRLDVPAVATVYLRVGVGEHREQDLGREFERVMGKVADGLAVRFPELLHGPQVIDAADRV